MVARVGSVAFAGIEVLDVDVQVQMASGLPVYTIPASGMPASGENCRGRRLMLRAPAIRWVSASLLGVLAAALLSACGTPLDREAMREVHAVAPAPADDPAVAAGSAGDRSPASDAGYDAAGAVKRAKAAIATGAPVVLAVAPDNFFKPTETDLDDLEFVELQSDWAFYLDRWRTAVNPYAETIVLSSGIYKRVLRSPALITDCMLLVSKDGRAGVIFQDDCVSALMDYDDALAWIGGDGPPPANFIPVSVIPAAGVP